MKCLSLGNCETTRIANGKRPAPRSASQFRSPLSKKGRHEAEMSDSESDLEDFKLEDDSDDDVEFDEEDEVEGDKEVVLFENGAVDDVDRKIKQEDLSENTDAELKAGMSL